MNIIIPDSLKKAISKNEIVLFVGSGTSIDLGMPDWNSLVKDIIDYIIQKTGNKELKMFKDILVPGGMTAIDVLSQIEKKNHRKLALDYVSNNLRLLENVNLDLHKNLFEICPRIITTNYDHAFEKALGDSVHVVSNSSNHGISNLSEKKEYIFKLHGDINDPDNCILFESDYKKLYIGINDRQDLFTSQLKNFVLNKTLVFVGFSMNDPYIKDIMDHMNGITQGMMKHHYLFTTDKDFNLPYIQPILLENYSQLSSVVFELKKEIEINGAFTEELPTNTIAFENKVFNEKENLPTFHLHSASPIDKDYDINLDYYQKAFGNYAVNLKIENLNIEGVRNCVNGYLILFTKTIKGNLIIEDEYLKSRQISVTELLDNISITISGIIIFTNELPSIDDFFQTDVPCLFILEENQSKIKRKIDLILYKLLNNKIDFIHENDVKIGDKHFTSIKLEKGIPTILKGGPKISKYIDKKLLSHFVGRKTDVENIARKIIDLVYEDKLLTIKGSGGIGKTTIIIKTVLELAKRNLFNKIEYISCQSISTYENLNYQISNCLEIDLNLNLIEELESLNNLNKSTVLILDNFETLLQLNEKRKILDLISKLCDYCLVVTTSRQILDLDFEELYELRNLTTDEGVEVFKNYYQGKLTTEDEKILRYDIVEVLLNNNPLAIKITSKGTPKSKRLETLREELQENIFNNENIDKIFETPEDINIEKSNSLFYSIKYSYDKLNPNEKFAFELLSLFPDGIHIENLKKFGKQNKDSHSKITDKEIKSLDDKSLLENSGGFLKLQSIVNRFSSHQFNNRPEPIKKSYFTLCFEYNDFFINFLQNILTTSESLPIQDDNINNYLKCLEFMEFVEKSNEDKLYFIDSVSVFFRNINQHVEFLDKLTKENFSSQFENISEKNLLRLIILQTIYWCKDFEYAIKELRDLFSNEDVEKFNMENRIDRLTYNKIFHLLTCEGESMFFIKDLIDKWYLKSDIISELFKLGLIGLANSLLKHEKDFGFGEYDIMLENGVLDIKELDNYISRLYKKETLELIQINYIKIKLDSKSNIDTKTFVITNPYTEGMISLIEALMEENIEKKQVLFESAIKNLKHIKYYYTEAVYHYCKFLKNTEKENLFKKYLRIGLNIATQYNFNYLDFKLNKLVDNTLVYNEDLVYERLDNIERRTFDLFIEQYSIERKNSIKINT